jgi:hypothetical protein
MQKANGAHSPVKFGDDPTKLVQLDQPELDYVIKEIARAPSGKFEDGQYELLQDGRQVARGDARTVIGELRKRRAYASIPLVAMDFSDNRSCVFRFRDVGDDTSPVIWRGGK